MTTQIRIVRTDSSDKNFQQLVVELDKDLSVRDGEDHDFYQQFNKILHIHHVLLAYENDNPVGCGAIKAFSNDSMEVKRMFVKPHKRGMGIASVILYELEQWAKEMGIRNCVLETGKKQPEAISLYKKNGYKIISNFGQYENVSTSVCFKKEL